eukprot:2748786-Amphidinium_carterae.1
MQLGVIAALLVLPHGLDLARVLAKSLSKLATSSSDAVWNNPRTLLRAPHHATQCRFAIVRASLRTRQPRSWAHLSYATDPRIKFGKIGSYKTARAYRWNKRPMCSLQ